MLYDLMAAKMIDELNASYAVIMELDTKKSRGGKSGLAGMVAETE